MVTDTHVDSSASSSPIHLITASLIAGFTLVIGLTLLASQANAQTSGYIYTLAGTGVNGYSGDNGLGTDAELGISYGIAVDSSGDVYFSDTNHQRVREILASNGDIKTVAGNGTEGYSGDGGAATSAEIDTPEGLAFDSSGNLYIADAGNMRIRKVNTSGDISTVAGNGTEGYSGDGGAATSAELDVPDCVTVDSSGNLYICDGENEVIRKVNTSGTISTYAGNGDYGFSGDGGAATSAELAYPNGAATDSSGNLYISDESARIREVTVSNHDINTVAGTGESGTYMDGVQATHAPLNGVNGVAVDGNGNIFIADSGNYRVVKVTASTGVISTVAGDGTYGDAGNDVLATSTEISAFYANGVAVGKTSGHFYLIDPYFYYVREVY